MTLARSRIEHLNHRSDYLDRVRKQNLSDIFEARLALMKALSRAEREQQRGLVELLKTALAATEDAMEVVG